MSPTPPTHPPSPSLTRIAEVQHLRRERWRVLMDDHILARIACDAVRGAARRFARGAVPGPANGVPDIPAWVEHFARLDPDGVGLALARDAIAATAAATPMRIGRVLAQYDLATARHARARNEVVLDNLGLARLFVDRCLRCDAPQRADLLQEAAIGLIRAIERFDVTRGTQFSTYAMYWIRHAVLHAMDDARDVVRLPGHVRAARRRIAVATREALASGTPPALSELATRLSLSEQIVARAATATLDAATDVATRHLGEVPPEDEWVERLDLEQFEARLGPAVAALEPRDRSILGARFGLSRERASLAAVAVEHGMSHEGVRQAALRTIQRLRRSLGLVPPARTSTESAATRRRSSPTRAVRTVPPSRRAPPPRSPRLRDA